MDTSSIILSSFRIGLDTLRANPMRTLLSTLGIIMGVGALVSVLSLGDGMARFARDQIERTTDLQSLSVTPSLFRTVDGQRFPRTDPVAFTFVDADSLGAALPPTTAVRLVVTGQALWTTPRDTTLRAAEVSGVYESSASAILPIAAGRFFSKEESSTGAPVAVVSRAFASAIDKQRPDAAIGDTILFQHERRVIVGVFADTSLLPGLAAVMPLDAGRRALPAALVGRPATFVVKAARVEDVTSIRTAIERWLGSRYGTDWKSRVAVASNESRVEQATQGMLVFKLFMGALTGISLVVGGIGIMNVLLASVTERTREIGIRKATGAAQRAILFQFLTESVTISAFGSLIGVVLGVVVAFAGTAIMRSISAAPIYAGFSASTFLVAVFASVVVGIVFGLYPALRAARLSPIEAMRHE